MGDDNNNQYGTSSWFWSALGKHMPDLRVLLVEQFTPPGNNVVSYGNVNSNLGSLVQNAWSLSSDIDKLQSQSLLIVNKAKKLTDYTSFNGSNTESILGLDKDSDYRSLFSTAPPGGFDINSRLDQLIQKSIATLVTPIDFTRAESYDNYRLRRADYKEAKSNLKQQYNNFKNSTGNDEEARYQYERAYENYKAATESKPGFWESVGQEVGEAYNQFNDTFSGKNAKALNAGLETTKALVNKYAPVDTSGKYGNLTDGSISFLDNAQSMLTTMNPAIGTMVGLVRQGNLILQSSNKNLITGQTNAADATADSLPLLGLLNAGLGTNLTNYRSDAELNARTLAAYNGFLSDDSAASEVGGKRVGVLGRLFGGYRGNENLIAETKLERRRLRQALDAGQDLTDIADSNLYINLLRHHLEVSGPNDIRFMLAGKHGLKLEKARNLLKKSNYTVDKLVDSIYENSEVISLGEPSHHYDFTQSEEWADAHGYYPDARGHRDDRVKKEAHPTHPSRGTFIDLYNFLLSDKGLDDSNYTLFGMADRDESGVSLDGLAVVTYNNGIVLPEITATPTGNYIYNPYDNLKIIKHKGGGEIQPTFINIQEPEYILEFQKGGEINIIPEGALHARKHNLDIDGITKKGIPVLDNEGNLQAEIEHSEIIFRLEVTEKLEELYKIFYSEDSSNSDKDEAALEAGKLLVDEILNNTLDNTNNIL